MTKRFPLMLLCASLALVACGEEKPAETAKPAAQPTAQAAAPATTAQPSTETAPADTAKASTADTTAATTAEKTTEAPADQAEPADVTAKAELVKPASLEVGKKRYETTCHVCHEAGLLNAPKLGDKENWAIRAKQGVEVLYQHSAKGIRSMPAQATGDVSEAEVYAAVDYMLSQVK